MKTKVLIASVLALFLSNPANAIVSEKPAKVQTQTQSKPKHIGANWDNRKSYKERGKTYYLQSKQQAKGKIETGKATWYCCYRKGTKTADGTLYGKHKMTAAHKTLPFGSIVEVENLANGKKVRVEITDRGPYKAGTILDLTPAAFEKLAPKSLGVIKIRAKVVGFRY